MSRVTFAESVAQALAQIPHGPICLTRNEGPAMGPQRCDCDREERMAQRVADMADILASDGPISFADLALHRAAALRVLRGEPDQ